MPDRLRSGAVALLAAWGLGACAGAPLRTESLDPARVEPGQTAFALLYSLELPNDLAQSIEPGACKLVVRANDLGGSGRERSLVLMPGNGTGIFDIEPGKKEFRELDCGPGKRWVFASDP